VLHIDFTGKFYAQKKTPMNFSYLLGLTPVLSCCLLSPVTKLILKWKIIKDIKKGNLIFSFPFKNIFRHTLMTLEITMHEQEQHSYKQCKLAKIF